MEKYTSKEMMTIAAARRITNSDIVFCGTGISMLAAMAAKHINAKKSVIMFETGAIGSSLEDLPLAVGDSRVMYNADVFGTLADSFAFMQNKFTGKNVVGILGAAQIDKYGNLNSTVIGDYFNPTARFAGSGGGCDVASFADRVIVFMKHEKRRFVKKLDYLTSPGWLNGDNSRSETGIATGGVAAVITDMGVLEFDKQSKRMYLKGYYPNIEQKAIVDNIGFEIDVSKASLIEPPCKEELFALRNKCDPQRLIL
ncbi:MAG: ketoacid-CoA transferase [Deltaproteobacteria bacterium]|nr:ketoacid-CoA transferase [Deltaproteobacteria bacterium]